MTSLSRLPTTNLSNLKRLNLATMYQWQIEYEIATGSNLILNRYDNGREQSSKSVDPKKVIRISLLPSLAILPQHDIFIDRSNGEYFVKWFGRMIMKKLTPAHYLNCVETNKYRVWVHHDGKVWVTHPKQEVYL